MTLRLNTLRWRLVLAFILVSVPPMLGAAFAVGTLVSRTFESNVADWLTETAHYFVSQIDESQNDADHAAQLLAKRLSGETLTTSNVAALIGKDVETLAIMGFTHVAVYFANASPVYASMSLPPGTALPVSAQKTILSLTGTPQDYLLNCAVVAVESPQGSAFVLVGTALDQATLVEGKAINALKIQLFHRHNGAFILELPATDAALSLQPPPEVIERLEAGDETVVYDDANDGIYKSLYAGIRDGGKHLVGAAFIGLGSDDSFVAQVSRFGIFPGIFFIGILLSVGAGLLLSGYLAMPLKALTAAVRSVTAGDYSQRLALKGGTELSELASGFNGMAEQLSKLRDLEERLRRRDRLSTLGEASAVIAHEVRNPLGIIKTSAEVVRNRADLRPAEARLMGYITDETRRIEKLIREVLDFAHPKPMVKMPVQAGAVLEDVLAHMQTELSSHAITARIIDEAPGAQLLGDADQVHQAFLNLTLNAVDAMSSGGVLEVTLRQGNGALCVTFADTGSGVAPEIAERMFDPFFTTKARGTGLGLAQVQSLAEALNGKVALVAKTTQGAAIALTLPLLSTAVQTGHDS